MLARGMLKLVVYYGVNASVYIITIFLNSIRADDYRGAFPWHGLGRPTGTDYFHCIRE